MSFPFSIQQLSLALPRLQDERKVVTVHALIHVLGFIKAFRLLPLPQLPVALSPAMGLLWLVALIAVILSQSLIFHAGREARWGTLPHAFILVAVLIGWGFWNFDRTWEHLRIKLLASSTGREPRALSVCCPAVQRHRG